jgi:hypothetical protein
MSEMVRLGIPEDPILLHALGRLTVAHGNLEMVQIMCLKTLEGLRPGEALEKWRRRSASKVRERIESTIEARGGREDTKAVHGLKELLLDARCASRRRNDLLHRFWAQRGDASWTTSPDGNAWEELPSVDIINDLTRAIERIAERLNSERFGSGLIVVLSPKGAKGDQVP